MKALIFLSILLMVSQVSAINYFGEFNSSDQYEVEDMLQAHRDNPNRTGNYSSSSMPMTLKDKQTILWIVLAGITAFALLLYFIIDYANFGGRNRP